MKLSAKKLLLTTGAIAFLAIGFSNSAVAAIDVDFAIGAPPPPIVEHPWARPYPEAVWVPGHYHWVRDQWVWYPGYYTYPPRTGAVWEPDGYVPGYAYRPGHWR